MVVRGVTQKKDGFKGKKKRSKSRPKNLKCFQCHRERNFKRNFPKRRNKNKKGKERSDDAIVASEVQYSDGYILLEFIL